MPDTAPVAHRPTSIVPKNATSSPRSPATGSRSLRTPSRAGACRREIHDQAMLRASCITKRQVAASPRRSHPAATPARPRPRSRKAAPRPHRPEDPARPGRACSSPARAPGQPLPPRPGSSRSRRCYSSWNMDSDRDAADSVWAPERWRSKSGPWNWLRRAPAHCRRVPDSLVPHLKQVLADRQILDLEATISIGLGYVGVRTHKMNARSQG